MEQTRILRFRDVEQLVRLSKGSIYRLIGKGTFPRPIRLGARAVGWHRDEVEGWLADRKRAGAEPRNE